MWWVFNRCIFPLAFLLVSLCFIFVASVGDEERDTMTHPEALSRETRNTADNTTAAVLIINWGYSCQSLSPRHAAASSAVSAFRWASDSAAIAVSTAPGSAFLARRTAVAISRNVSSDGPVASPGSALF